MKKILLLTAVFALLAFSKADAYTTTRLQVHSYDNGIINVYIDGVAYGNGTNYQSIENLAPGYHEMQVTEWYTDDNNNSTEQVIFTGNVTIDQGYDMNTVVNPGNNLQVISEVALYEPRYAPVPVVSVNFRPYVVCGVGFSGRYYHAPTVCYVPRPHYSSCRPPVVVCERRGGYYDHGYRGHEHCENGYHGGGYRGGGYHGYEGHAGGYGGREYHGGGDHYSHYGPRR